MQQDFGNVRRTLLSGISTTTRRLMPELKSAEDLKPAEAPKLSADLRVIPGIFGGKDADCRDRSRSRLKV